jgi:hypothetical protein
MRRLAIAVALALLAAGCGTTQADAPTTALLTDVRVTGTTVSFDFRSPPREVRAAYRPRAQIVESGSGAKVEVKGDAFLVVTFTPAASADLQGEKPVLTYTGPKRLPGPGPVREAVKIGDFESQLDWAIGLDRAIGPDRRRSFDVTRDGPRVTVTFAG